MKLKELNVGKEVAALEPMTVKQLKERYAAVFGEGTTANNRTWLFKRIVWRLTAAHHGCVHQLPDPRRNQPCDTPEPQGRLIDGYVPTSTLLITARPAGHRQTPVPRLAFTAQRVLSKPWTHPARPGVRRPHLL